MVGTTVSRHTGRGSGGAVGVVGVEVGEPDTKVPLTSHPSLESKYFPCDPSSLLTTRVPPYTRPFTLSCFLPPPSGLRDAGSSTSHTLGPFEGMGVWEPVTPSDGAHSVTQSF